MCNYIFLNGLVKRVFEKVVYIQHAKKIRLYSQWYINSILNGSLIKGRDWLETAGVLKIIIVVDKWGTPSGFFFEINL